MSGLENLLGGDMAKSLGGLIEQFEAGNAHAVTPEDAASHHDAVAKHLTPEQYEQAAIDAASKLTPAQRRELAAKLTHAAKTHGPEQAKATAEKHSTDPASAESVGKLLSGLQSSPGGLTGLLAGGAQELMGNAAVRSALLGVATSAAKTIL